MDKEPSNTREQCAFDSGAFKRKMLSGPNIEIVRTAETWQTMRDQRNPHKKGSKEHEFWNAGFDSVIENGK